jgi:co-chaperonin GroES (HSP10)
MTKAQQIFSSLAEANLYELRGDCMIVEELPTEEVTTKGGLIVASARNSYEQHKADKPMFVRVLQIGNGWTDEDGRGHEVDFKPGQILLVGPLATVRFFADILGVVSNVADMRIGVMQGVKENAFMIFDNEEVYKKAYTVAAEAK